MSPHRKLLVSYVSILTAISALCITVSKLLGVSGMAVAGIYMFGPALSATFTYLLCDRQRFKQSGLKRGSLRDYGRYYALALLITLVQFVGFSFLGAVTWDFTGDTFLTQLETMMPGQDISSTLPAGMSAQTMLFLFAVGGLTIFNIMPGIISGLGEEYGWRGLMFPALQSRKPWVGYGLGGTVWYVWHLPLMLLFPMPKLSWTFLAASSASLVGTIAMHVFLCRAYTQSGSIFVPSLTHATFNNAARSFAYYAILTNQLVGNVVVALSMVAVVVVQSRILTNRRLPPSATTS